MRRGSLFRKAEVTSDAFVYILSIIVLALILFFGYKAITNFIGQTNKVSVIEMKNSVANTVERLQTEYGSVEIKEIRVPGDVDTVCFVDLSKDFKILDNEFDPCLFKYKEKDGGVDIYEAEKELGKLVRLSERYPHVADAWESKIGTNMFLLQGTRAVDDVEIGAIAISYQFRHKDTFINVDSGGSIDPDTRCIGTDKFDGTTSELVLQRFFCIPVQTGSITLKFEGKGNRVLLSPMDKEFT